MKKSYWLVVVVFIMAGSYFFNKEKTHETTDTNRNPSTTTASELIEGSKKVLIELNNPSVFNPSTCEAYVVKITDYLYNLPADYFIPHNQQEVDYLKQDGPAALDTMFQIRITLNQKLNEFFYHSSLTRNCVNKIREGYQYARFAEEYLLDWLHLHRVYQYTPGHILEPRLPNTWVNPQFNPLELKTGDVLLIRGKSYVSAMIARIGDEEGNFSHLALIVEDKPGKKYVAEALIQKGVIITPLEEWLKQEDARVALYRFRDQSTAQAAGKIAYEKLVNKKIRYDFAMNDSDYSTFFCSEIVRFAYDLATSGKVLVPQFRSTVSKFKNSDYPKSLGVKSDTLFAPYDIEVDPRFQFIAESRHFPLLRQVRMQDAVLQSMYSWMVDKKYTFNWALTHSTKAYFAKIIRQFGFVKTVLPTYMPMDSLKTNVQFEAASKMLEKNLYTKEADFYKAKGHLPSFQDMLKINEEYRLEDCRSLTQGRQSTFHYFFRAPNSKCE